MVMKSAFRDTSRGDLFKAISDLCAMVTVTTDPAQLLEISLKRIIALFQAKRGSIFILGENGEDLLLETSAGMAKKEKELMVKKMGQGIVGRVAELKKPFFVEDITKDKRFHNFKRRGSYSTPSFICAPLMIKDQLVGVINIADRDNGKYFSEDDLQLLDFLTTQIALNYRRIQLLNKFKLIVKEKEVLKNKLGKSTAEKKSLKKKVDLNERLATIGKLAGGIAHEFNNPLDGVMRYTNLCLEQTGDDDLVHGYLLEIKHGLNRMANIVRNLLACSRNTPPDNATINIAQAIEHCLWNKETDIQHKNITVHREIQSGLPRFTDYGLERVLSNLIANAIDAIDVDGKILIEAQVEDKHLYLVVEDDGCGIPQGKINTIFDPFFTTKDIDKGCGLGLTIVGEIVKIYNGKIDIESEEGKGTRFTVKIPVNEAA